MSAVGSRKSGFRRAVWRAPCSALVLGALLGFGPTGCSTLPGSTSPTTVESVVERGPYLDVSVSMAGAKRRFFTAAGEPCRSLLKPEAAVEYVNLGPLGQLQAGGVSCIPAGIGTLAEWRDARPRPQVGPQPQKQANFKLEYQDADVVMVRGMIPLLGLIAWPGMGDTLLVLPQTPACKALVPVGVATIQYNEAGADPYVLLDDRRVCEVAGLIQPVGER